MTLAFRAPIFRALHLRQRTFNALPAPGTDCMPQEQAKIDFEFCFDSLRLIEKQEGEKPVIEAVISDNEIDRGSDVVTDKALSLMVTQLQQERIPLLRNHRGTFAIGESVDAEVRTNGPRKELVAAFEMDPEFAETKQLLSDIKAGRSSKQLSIGGMINHDDPKAVTFRADRATGRLTRRLNNLKLDHVAVTRKDHAMNERTRFRSVREQILRSIDQSGAWPDYAPDLDEEPSAAADVEKQRKIAPRTAPWSFNAADGNALISRGGMAMFSGSHAFRSPGGDPNLKGTYKLPHHKISGGEWTLFPRGVVAATVVFLGGRGGISLKGEEEKAADPKSGFRGHAPATDRDGVRRHLLAHYREIGMTPPEGLTKSYEAPSDAEKDWSEEAFRRHHEHQGFEMGWLDHFDFESFVQDDDFGEAGAAPSRRGEENMPDGNAGGAAPAAAEKQQMPNWATILLGLEDANAFASVFLSETEKGLSQIEAKNVASALSKANASRMKDLHDRLKAVLEAAGIVEVKSEPAGEAPAPEGQEPAEAAATEEGQKPAAEAAPAPATGPAASAEAASEAASEPDPASSDVQASGEAGSAPADPAAQASPEPAEAQAGDQAAPATVEEEVVTKAALDKLAADLQKTFVSSLSAVVESALNPLTERLGRLEAAAGGSQSLPDEGGADVERSDPASFKSLFNGVRPHVQEARRDQRR